MKYAAPVRRELGIRTVFNILGPLTNPAGAQAQLLGVAQHDLGEKMANVLKLLGTKRAMVIHGEDGLDEITLSGQTHVWELNDGNIQHYAITPEQAGLPRTSLNKVKGGTPQENAEALRRLLQGEKGPIRDIVLLNTAAVLVVGGVARDLKDGVAKAAQSIDSSAALKKLDALVHLSQRLT
jgi:anthranilate phosphoribosyltransferase